MPPSPRLIHAALLVLAACGQRDEFLRSYDPCQQLLLAPAPNASDAQIAAVEEAARMWRDSAGARIVASGSSEGVVRLPVTFVDTGLFYGWFDDGKGLIRIANQVTGARELAVVIAHEVGHAYGLHHVEPDERLSLMNPGNTEIGPTEGDLAELRARWGTCEPAAGDEP